MSEKQMTRDQVGDAILAQIDDAHDIWKTEFVKMLLRLHEEGRWAFDSRDDSVSFRTRAEFGYFLKVATALIINGTLPRFLDLGFDLRKRGYPTMYVVDPALIDPDDPFEL